MARPELYGEKSTKSAIPNLIFPELAETGKQRIEAMFEIQKELFETLEKTSKDWLARVKSEADLASELVTKLTAARSGPDAATAYQEWMNRQLEMFTEYSRRILADSEMFMKASTRLLSNGSSGGSN